MKIIRCEDCWNLAQTEAINEFAKRLKTHECLPEYPWDEPFVLTSNIDQIAKEMKGEENGGTDL